MIPDPNVLIERVRTAARLRARGRCGWTTRCCIVDNNLDTIFRYRD